MLRSLPSAIDDARDTLYEPTAAYSQFLGSDSITFIFIFPFLLPLVFSCLAFLGFSFFSFLLVFSPPCLFFSFLYLFFFSLFILFSN